MDLPKPEPAGGMTLAEALHRRRSRRSYRPDHLTADQISQILWAAQGVSQPSRGFRTAPSAGGTLPLTIYAVLPGGVFRYEPKPHWLTEILSGDVRRPLARACLEQYWLTPAGMTVVIAASFERTTLRYGDRGKRYVWLEAGHVGQNICLQAEAIALGAVAIGAYDDRAVARVVHLPENLLPVYLVVVGNKAERT